MLPARCSPGTQIQRQSLRRRWLRQPTPGVASQQRPRKCVRSQDRPHHQRQPTLSGTAFNRTPACRPHTPIPSIPSSTPTRRSRSTRWSQAIRTSSAPISSISSIPGKLVLEHLRAQQLRAGAANTFPSCSRRAATTRPSPPSAATTTPIPQGRKVTQWQINDNLDWTRGKQHLPLRHQYAAHRRQRLRSGRGNRAHRRLQRSGRVYVRRGLHREHRHFPSRSKSASPPAILTSTRWIPTSPPPRPPSSPACAPPGTPIP